MERVPSWRLDDVDLDRDERDGATEDLDHVEESFRDPLGDQHGKVLTLRPLAFDQIPVLDGSDYVARVCLSEHDLNLVHRIFDRVLEQDIKPTTGTDRSFLGHALQIAQTEAGGIIPDLFLEPPLVEAKRREADGFGDWDVHDVRSRSDNSLSHRVH